MKNTLKTLGFLAVLALSGTALSASALAEVDISPPTNQGAHSANYSHNNNTHPALKLTPDKSEIINLNSAAASIIVGNSKHLNIMTDSAKRLVIIPRAPGASHFTALDHDGNVIMQRHVIVAAPQRDYLRIRRNCNGASEGCAPTSVYYCPDGCHEVAVSDGTEKTVQQPQDSNMAPSGMSDYGAPNPHNAIPPNATPE